MNRPPCWPAGQPCPNSCAAELHDRVAHNRTQLHGPWAGWRLAGRDLVSPDGDRISPERIRGILWRETLEIRRSGSAQRKKRVSRKVVTVIRVANDDWHRDRFGTVAG